MPQLNEQSERARANAQEAGAANGGAEGASTRETADGATRETADTPARDAASDDATLASKLVDRDTLSLIDRLKPLWPLIVGLTFGRAGLIVACYGSYAKTDEGLFTDGAMLIALAVMFIAFIALAARKTTLSKRTVNNAMRACVAIEAVTIVALGVVDLTRTDAFVVSLALCAACTFFASFAIFYWLRRARGTSTTAAAVFVFVALLLSEIELYLATFFPAWAACFAAALLSLLQYPCMRWARSQTQPHSIKAPTQSSDYFGFTRTMIQSKQFLIATAFGIGLLSIVIGLLRGYPDGASIPFTLPTRTAYGLLTVALSAAIIALVVKGRRRVMTVGMFLVMECLACVALLCYAAFPGALEIGAVFTTTLNALMVGFTWYIIVAFMSYGWRDPYYYAMAGWFVWLGARAVARVALITFYPLSANDILMNSLMTTLVVVSTQVVFMQFLSIAKKSPATSADEEKPAEQAAPTGAIARIMGLDQAQNLATTRQNATRNSVEIMGKQFMLSEREVEVLALYAQGFTQKRVAEELFISPGTAHAHIKRIYAKTDMHSRQEILDYIERYAS
ncbi:MAG: LuxR C-terminal-related transcriptional regulator [Eggerthellaceae bacterium]|nr:LuxR C-terminal-related transcriptional regulator [Eggerthellaceae bacterium]